MNIVQFLSTRGETQVGVVQPDGETLCVLADVPGRVISRWPRLPPAPPWSGPRSRG